MISDARTIESPTDKFTAPDVGLDLGRRQALLAVRVGQVDRRACRMRYASAGPTVTTYCFAPDDRGRDPDGPVRLVAREPVALVAELLVGGLDVFDRHTAMPADLVVVVLAVDGSGDSASVASPEVEPGVRPVTSR